MREKRRSQHSNHSSSPYKLLKLYEQKPSQELNRTRPETISTIRVPTYQSSLPIEESSSLPQLPPIQSVSLSEAPFIHSSTVESKYGDSNTLTYERLEFLGDAYIELIASRLIYSRFPQLLTGKQSALRESLVRNNTLAIFSRHYGFEKRIKISSNISEKGWEKVLGDVFEAYVAAVILSDPDSGFSTAETWLTNLWAPILLEYRDEAIVNWKNDLSRLIGGRDVKIEYLEDAPMRMTTDGKQRHSISVYLSGWGYDKRKLGSGQGTGKKEAGMVAAGNAIIESSTIIKDITEMKRIREHNR